MTRDSRKGHHSGFPGLVLNSLLRNSKFSLGFPLNHPKGYPIPTKERIPTTEPFGVSMTHSNGCHDLTTLWVPTEPFLKGDPRLQAHHQHAYPHIATVEGQNPLRSSYVNQYL